MMSQHLQLINACNVLKKFFYHQLYIHIS